MAATLQHAAAQQALAGGRQLQYRHEGSQPIVGYPPQNAEDAQHYRFEGAPPGQLGMQRGDLIAMQQHLISHGGGTAYVQTAPVQQPQPGTSLPIGMGRPPSQQAMRQQSMGAATRPPGPQQISYYANQQPGHMGMPATPVQQYASQQAQAQAAQQASQAMAAHSIASPAPMQGYPVQQPTPGPSRMAMRPAPPTRQGSIGQGNGSAMLHQQQQPSMATRGQTQMQARAQEEAQAAAEAQALAQKQHLQAQAQQHQRVMMAAAATNRPISAQTLQPSASGVAIMRLLQYSDLLSQAMQLGTIEALQAFVGDYFTEYAQVTYQLYDSERDETRSFDIPACTVPRYLSALQESGVRGLYLCYDSPQESHIMSGNAVTGYQIDCKRITYMTHYSNGTQISSKGSQRARFVRVPRPPEMPEGPPLLKLETLEYSLREHHHLVMREHITIDETQTRPMRSGSGGSLSAEVPSPTLGSGGSAGSAKASPAKRRRTNNMSPIKSEANGELTDLRSDAFEDNKPGTSSSTASYPTATFVRAQIPEQLVNSLGVTQRTMRCLELAESVAMLRPLVSLSREHGWSPIEAFERYINEMADKTEGFRQFLQGDDYPPTPPMQMATPAAMPGSTPGPASSVHAASPRSPVTGTRRKTAGSGDAKSPIEEPKMSPTAARPRARSLRNNR